MELNSARVSGLLLISFPKSSSLLLAKDFNFESLNFFNGKTIFHSTVALLFGETFSPISLSVRALFIARELLFLGET